MEKITSEDIFLHTQHQNDSLKKELQDTHDYIKILEKDNMDLKNKLKNQEELYNKLVEESKSKENSKDELIENKSNSILSYIFGSYY